MIGIFQNLSIRWKIAFVCVMLSSLSVLIAATTLTNNEVRRARPNLVEYVQILGSVVGSNCKSAIIFSDADSAQSALATLGSDKNILAARVFDAEGNPFADYIHESYVEKISLPEKALDPQAVFNENGLEMYSRILSDDELLGTIYVRSSTDAIDQAINSTIRLAAIVVVACVALAIGLALWAQQSITRPLRKVVDKFKNLDRDLTARFDDSRGDEIGELASSINGFMERIHQLVLRVAETSQQVAGSASEIAGSTEQLSSSMQNQTHQASECSQAMEQMAETVRKIAEMTSNASNNAVDAGNQAEKGSDVVSQTIQRIRLIAEVVNKTAEVVDDLGRRGDEIDEVINVINDIADQTNLLALNASIEAARAGEHGRGFAVVADEVRKLAERTTSATKEVTDSITAIRKGTQTAVTQINEGTQRVTQGVELAEQAGDSLISIVDQSSQVAQMIQSISSATDEQASTADHVNQNVEGIAGITQEAAQATDSSAQSANHMLNQAHELQSLINQFKI